MFYETCGRDVRIHAVSLAHRRAQPVWRVVDRSRNSRERRFVVGSTPPGFEEEIRFAESTLAGHYLVIIDSSYLGGETTTFEADDLRTDLFFGANNEYFSEDQLLDGALCDTD